MIDEIRNSDVIQSFGSAAAGQSSESNSIIGLGLNAFANKIADVSYKKAEEKGQLPYGRPKEPEAYVPQTTAGKIAGIAGSFAGDVPLMGLNIGSNLLKAKTVLNPVIREGISQGITGGILGTAQGVLSGESAQDVAKQAGAGMLLGGAGGLLFGKLGNMAANKAEKSFANSQIALDDIKNAYKNAIVSKVDQPKVPKVDSVYKSQYNNIDDIKGQISKYYDGVNADREMIDNATQAITDLKKTEDLHAGGNQAGNTLNNLRGNSEAIQSQKPFKTVGKAFSNDLINTGKVNLAGNKFNDVKDLATLSQVYRDPRFETFRIVYTNNGTVVGTEAISSRMPGSAAVFVGDKEGFVKYLKNKMGRVKADGYYLLHNHPGKTVKPSQADINATSYYANTVPGFKGHIIINSNKYTEMYPVVNNGQIALSGNEDVPLTLGKDILYNPSVPHPLLGTAINSSDTLAKVAKQVQLDKNMSTAFFVDSQNNIRGIMEINNGMIKNTADNNFRNFLRNQAIEHGGRNVILIGDSSVKQQISDLVKSGDLLDAVVSGESGSLRDSVFQNAQPNTWMGKSEAAGKLLRPPKPFETQQGYQQVGPGVASIKTITPVAPKQIPFALTPQAVEQTAASLLPELKITSKFNRATQIPIWEARPTGRLTQKNMALLKPEMQRLGGFYSKTNRAFVFDNDPTEELKKLTDVAQKETPIEERLLANSDNWKDKSMLSYNRETLERNLEDIAGADAPELIKTYVEPRQKSVADMTRFLNTERSDLKQLNIKPRSKDSQLLMEFGENRISLEELKNQTANWENIIKANTVLREKYNKYLEMANEVLERNGYDPIPKRDDYFMHFQEISDKLDMFGIPNNKLPTDINGLTADFTPGKSFFASALRRTGNETSLDAMAGIDKYLDGISKVIYLTDDIQRLRGLESAIRKKYGEGSRQLSNFVVNLREYTNNLAGKKSLSDRGMESDIGRGVYRAAEVLKRQVGANAIGFNVSSALTNFIPLTQSLATTNKQAFVKGMMETLGSVFKNDGFIDRSDFLTRRFGSDPLSVKLWTTRNDLKVPAKVLGNVGAGYGKARDAGFWIFGVVDKFVAQTIVRGKYNELIEKGLSPEAALKQADNWGVRLMADRSIGAQANIFNKKGLMGAITQFQTEVNNQLSFIFKDIPRSAESKAAAASAIAQVFLFGYLFNNLYAQAVGRRPAFDPIGVVLQAYEDYNNPEVTDQEANKKLIENVANQLPFASMVTSQGGRIPLTESLPNPINAFSGTTNSEKELSKIPKLILPTGAGQIKKTIEGMEIFQNSIVPGKYKDSAEGEQLVYPVEDSPGNKLRAALFGQYSFPEAREYYDNTRTPLTPKQTQVVETMAQRGVDPQAVYNQIQLLKPLKKKSEEIKSINSNADLTFQQKQLFKNLLYKKE
ncbi:hypothetical protein [Dehalobacter sp. TeCB1]|uniref:hypothetical protein n=1 Tax=Dehalobacter sp. TeCB1 TaxID=1843715 RepID=UPI001A9A3115|nr:hypothetical protein [Dehalobacter sp. TeCB1]